MSLIPLIFGDYHACRPSRLLDQHFGLGLTPEDLLEPLTSTYSDLMMRNPLMYYKPCRLRNTENDAGSMVKMDKDIFQINLDVQQFRPEEITVKVTGENTITVEGKHEEKQDEHGFISIHFVRKYVLPKDHNMNLLEFKLSSDGVLTISAPKTNQKEIDHKNIAITRTEEPARPVENKKTKE